MEGTSAATEPKHPRMPEPEIVESNNQTDYQPPRRSLNEEGLPTDILEMTNIPPYWDSALKLGSGAFGEIHLVHSDRPSADGRKMVHKEFALKIVKFERNELVNVMREIEMHQKCRDHENVLFAGVSYCQPLGNGYRVQMCLEYAALGDLTLFAMKRKEEKYIAYACKEVVYALAYIHDRDIVHGDLSVRNVLVTHKGVVKVADFGMADIVANTSRPGQYRYGGTPGYIAPEVLNMAGYDSKADMWSLGTFALFLLIGCNPFKVGMLFDMQSYRRQLSEKFYPDLTRLPLSNNFKSFMSDLRHYDPDERCDSYEVLSEPFIQHCCTQREFMEHYKQVRAASGLSFPYSEHSEVFAVPIDRE